METDEIKKYENEALAFARGIYGNNLADAMYLGTFGETHYFGPVFYDSKDSSTITPRTPPTEKNKVKENRNPWLYTTITMLTVTLSNLVIFTRMTKELNRISGSRDELWPYLAAVFINIFTSGICGLIWFSHFTGTLGEEMRYRGITYKYNMVRNSKSNDSIFQMDSCL